jgi:hypothetical protein
MVRQFLVACVGVALCSPAFAGPYQVGGTYSAVDTQNIPGAPTINDTGNGSLYLSSPFSENLNVGNSTGPMDFLLVSPTSGSGTVNGSIQIDFSLSGPNGSTVTGVTSTQGANQASIVGGKVQIDANYSLNYSSQTDCITWTSSCVAGNNNGQRLTDTLAISFANGAVLDIGLYDYADWNMEPDISFDLVTPPVQVPEPASLALFGTGFAALLLLSNRELSRRHSISARAA